MGKGGFSVQGLGSAPKRGKIAAFEHGNGQKRAKAVRVEMGTASMGRGRGKKMNPRQVNSINRVRQLAAIH